MVDNQDQEDVDPILYKQKSDLFEPVPGEGKLWVKLKIPGDEDIEDQIIGFQEKDQRDNPSKIIERVCYICHKEFRSGKALGGHMRIHVHEAINKDLVSKKNLKTRQRIKFKKQNPPEGREIAANHNGGSRSNIIKQPTCKICGKSFPSIKALFGHMRCHPERDWRGINPPSKVKVKNISSSSSSSLSDDQMEVLDSSDLGNEAVDLTESLRGWPVTARRGRRALVAEATPDFSSSEENQLQKAVDDLMVLARDNSFRYELSHSPKVDTLEAPNSNLPVCKASGSKLNKLKNDLSSSKLRTHSPAEQLRNEKTTSNDVLEDQEGNCLGFYDKLDKKKDIMEQLDDRDAESANLKVMIKSRKKRKRVKLSDLELAQKVSPLTPVQEPDKYICNTCGKSFPTHQALGGHKARHYKFKIVIHDKSGNLSNPIAHVEEKLDNSHSSFRMLDFDLNELPPSEDEAGFECQLAVDNCY